MYIKVVDGTVVAFPYGLYDLMRDNPNTSFPERMPDEALEQFGIYFATPQEIPQPFDAVTQNAAIGTPVVLGGEWIQTWDITPASDADVAQRLKELAQSARNMRTDLLAETDWAGLSDTVMTPEMSLYRQALRDITSQDGFPRNIVWPAKPK